MIWHLIKKDWKLLWPMVGLVTSIQLGLEWADANFSVIPPNVAAVELFRPLSIAWFLSIAALAVAVIHQDPIPGIDQDWLIRPLRRRDLLLAKMGFLALTVSLPMFALNSIHALLIGLPAGQVFGTIAYKELYTYVFLIIPVIAFAATTRSMWELMTFGAALMVVYAVSSALSAFVFGAGRCPTCGSGLVWQEHLLQRMALTGGACVVLGLQYFRRRTEWSRWLVLAGGAVLIFVQLPWGLAFWLQQQVSGTPGAHSAVSLQAGTVELADHGDAPRSAAARQATRALLHGDVDQAVDYLQTRGRVEPVDYRVPVQAVGLAADEYLLVDRAEATLTDATGRVRYRNTLHDQLPTFLNPPVDASVVNPADGRQSVRVPADVMSGPAPATELELEYSLTLLTVVEHYRLPALHGQVFSSRAGLCRTVYDEDAVTLRCRAVGRTPFCFSAVLQGPDGAHNPEVRKCLADYRPYLPQFSFVLSYYGLDLPVRDRTGAAHYAVDESQLRESHVVFRIYAQRDHEVRRVRTPL